MTRTVKVGLFPQPRDWYIEMFTIANIMQYGHKCKFSTQQHYIVPDRATRQKRGVKEIFKS